MAELKPMKGAHLVMNEEVLLFIRESVGEILECYTDAQHDEDAKVIIRELEMMGWDTVKDRFGTKVYKAMDYAEATQQEDKAELRVGTVLKKDNTLSLDIRVWGNY